VMGEYYQSKNEGKYNNHIETFVFEAPSHNDTDEQLESNNKVWVGSKGRPSCLRSSFIAL